MRATRAVYAVTRSSLVVLLKNAVSITSSVTSPRRRSVSSSDATCIRGGWLLRRNDGFAVEIGHWRDERGGVVMPGR